MARLGAKPKPKIGTHNKARIVAVIGASGMGKGWYIKSELLPTMGQTFVFSPLEETDKYGDVLRVKPTRSIADLIEAGKSGKSAVFVPSNDAKAMSAEFGLFCRSTWHFPGCCAHVEELSNVTTPSWAPPPWKKLSTACRHRGMALIGSSQRPAQIDKDFLGNCTDIRCFRLMYENDAKVMGGVLRLGKDWPLIMDLPDYHFIHRDMSKRVNVYGSMTGERFASIHDMVGLPNMGVPGQAIQKKPAPPRKKVATRTPGKSRKTP